MTQREPARTFEDLIAQLRRAAVSVPGNIAEGFKRRGRADKARLLNVAEGSLEEARYYLRLARDLEYTPDRTLVDRAAEVGRLLGSYARTILSS